MKTPKTTEEMVEEFEEDFRDYLNASIAYAEIQEPYQALSSEDEIKWLKKRVTQLANSIHTQSALEAEGRKVEEGEILDWMGHNQALTDLADYHRSKVIE